ncbi:MAG: hypothetical protein ACRDU0_06905 [Mycobacterium sp.]
MLAASFTGTSRCSEDSGVAILRSLVDQPGTGAPYEAMESIALSKVGSACE